MRAHWSLPRGLATALIADKEVAGISEAEWTEGSAGTEFQLADVYAVLICDP